jgi:hypothetical protein
MAESNDTKMFIIKKRWLIMIYAIIPVLATLVAVDYFLLGKALQPFLTTEILFFPLYILLFELPHIIASLTTFADKEYVAHYKKNLFIHIPVLLGTFGIIFAYSFTIGILLYALYTMYHVTRQQTGIALLFTKQRDFWHECWTYLGVASAFFGYVIVFLIQTIDFSYLYVASIFIVPSVVFFLLVSVYIFIRSSQPAARLYISGVVASVVASQLFLFLNYLFLAIFVIRFIHDATAFVFYFTHDLNRNKISTHNYIYFAFLKIGIPIVVALPLIALSLNYIIRFELMVFQIGLLLFISMSLTHYYLESVMWKRDSVHRSQLRFE